MPNCVYLLNKGCSLITCVMGIISNIVQRLHMLLAFLLLQGWKTTGEIAGAEVEFIHTSHCFHVLSSCHLKHGVIDPNLPPPQMQDLQLIKIVAGTSMEGD